VEDMTIGHCIIAGNTVEDRTPGGRGVQNQDVFTGSLMHFYSHGYNRFGVIDFSQILVPVGERGWDSFCRKHYPKAGDREGVAPAEVLDLAAGVTVLAGVVSRGVDAGGPAVLHYAPHLDAVDQIPAEAYRVPNTYADSVLAPGGTNDFLATLLVRIEARYPVSVGFAANFTSAFETFLATVDSIEGDVDPPEPDPYVDPEGHPILTLADTQWFGPPESWTKEPENFPYVYFWRELDKALMAEAIPALGSELLGDDAWNFLFSNGDTSDNGDLTIRTFTRMSPSINLLGDDQRGYSRPCGSLGDIGAIERP